MFITPKNALLMQCVTIAFFCNIAAMLPQKCQTQNHSNVKKSDSYALQLSNEDLDKDQFTFLLWYLDNYETSIVSLDVSNTDIVSEQLNTVLTRCPRLLRLDASGCTKLSDPIKLPPHLQEIKLNNTGLTNKRLNRLLKNLMNVQPS
jgi:hypothetical protein